VTTAEPTSADVIRPPDVWRGPVPADEAWTRPYWEALRRHELSIQRCRACGAWQHPPVVACPSCGSDDLAFQPTSGRGEIYSVTVCHREFGLQFGVPWVGAYVTLDEGVRVATNIVNCTVDDVAIGLPVSVVYQDYDDIELTLAFFELAEGAAR